MSLWSDDEDEVVETVPEPEHEAPAVETDLGKHEPDPEPEPESEPEAEAVSDVLPNAGTGVKVGSAAAGIDATALVFLDDAVARKLAVAWVSCGGDDEAWFEAAGLDRYDKHARRIARCLRINNICRTGGVTDEMAVQYVKAVISRPLTAVSAAAKKVTKS